MRHMVPKLHPRLGKYSFDTWTTEFCTFSWGGIVKIDHNCLPQAKKCDFGRNTAFLLENFFHITKDIVYDRFCVQTRHMLPKLSLWQGNYHLILELQIFAHFREARSWKLVTIASRRRKKRVRSRKSWSFVPKVKSCQPCVPNDHVIHKKCF